MYIVTFIFLKYIEERCRPRVSG